MTDFAHLHLHTDFSLLDGAGRISDYVKKTVEYGMPAIAITDHGNMFGAINFYKAVEGYNKEHKGEPDFKKLKAIIGCEFYVSPYDITIKNETNSKRYHLILLAKNDHGYRNLLKLSSVSWTKGFYTKPRIDWDLLKTYHEDLICLSACLAGEVPQQLLNGNYDAARAVAMRYRDLFGEDYYLEIQNHGIEEQKQILPLMKRLSEETGIRLVATNDCHYVNRDDAEAQDALMCLGMNKKVNDKDRMKFETDQFYFKSGDEMREALPDFPEAIAETLRIAEKCDGFLDLKGPELPDYPAPEGYQNIAEYLTAMANEGLHRRYGDDFPPEYQERLDYELGVIIKMGFEGYYLIVWDYIHWAKTHGCSVGPGRGSGAGSLVAYCIEITDVDPMKYGLIFERFLNPERISLPDFDVDFSDEGRQSVIQYVTEKYGKPSVGQICTFGTLKAKQVLKDVARVLDIPLADSNAISGAVPDTLGINLTLAIEGGKIGEDIIIPPSKELKAWRERGGVYEDLFRISLKLEGMSRHVSLHAAGVVIGRTPLDNYVPLWQDPKDPEGGAASQYTMTVIEECGLVKMDFLGLKTLSLIDHAVALIRKKVPDFDINKIRDDDKATFDMLCEGDSAAVFQFESGGMVNTLKKAQPRSISDLAALNALYRPGPMENIDAFCFGRHNPDQVKYEFPELKPILEDTYGVIVYQEQVMNVARVYAGFTMGGADNLRKIMGKKKKKEIPKQHDLFVEGAGKLGHSKEQAEKLFKLLEPFAGYGFNKSHAVAYAFLSYQTAYLKANYPVEFLASNLTNEITNPTNFMKYLALAKSKGIRIIPPDINKSTEAFGTDGNSIVFGLRGIKNVGEMAVQNIISERETNGPFKDFSDFLMRVDSKTVSQKTIENLADAGAFDCFGINRPTAKLNIPAALEYIAPMKADAAAGQGSLFGDDDEGIAANYTLIPHEDYTPREKLFKEHDLLGFYVSGHPLDNYAADIKTRVTYTFDDISRIPPNRTVSFIALVDKVTPKLTKTGKEMGILALSDFTGNLEGVLFQKTWQANSDRISENNVYGIQGKFSPRDGGDSSFIIDRICQPEELPLKELTSFHLRIERNSFREESLTRIADVCTGNPGSLFTYIHISDGAEGEKVKNEKVVLTPSRYNVKYDETLSDRFTEISGIKEAWFD